MTSPKNPLHSAQSSEWMTPTSFLEAARATMGGIDLDPASSRTANARVLATVYYTKNNNGLTRPWAGRVYLNPPGGLVPEFWTRLLAFLKTGTVTEAVWMGYSLQQLQTLQSHGRGPTLAASALCFPNRRIAFLNELGVPATSPTHANYIAYIGPNVKKFRAAHAGFGEVRA